MIFRIACVGRIKETYLNELIRGYEMAINKHGQLEICEVPDESIPRKTNDSLNSQLVKREGERLKKIIGRSDYVIALCVDGKKTGMNGLAAQIKKADDRGFSAVTFVIGGSLGLHEDIIRRADYRMSISDMTFPHQLMRAVLAEQLMLLVAGTD